MTASSDLESTEPQSERAEAPAPSAGLPGATAPPVLQRGKTVHGEAANAGHRVLAPDDAEVEAYLEIALNAPAPESPDRRPADRSSTGHGRRPRLRQPVRPADRAARARAQRLLGAPAARHAVGRDRAARPEGGHPVRRSRTRVYDADAPRPDPRHLVEPDPRPRHLLRRAADGPRARRRRPAGRATGSTDRPPSPSPTTTACSRASSASSRSG